MNLLTLQSTWQAPLIDGLITLNLALWTVGLLLMVLLARWGRTATSPLVRALRAGITALCQSSRWKQVDNLATLAMIVLFWFTTWGLVAVGVTMAMRWPYAVRRLAGWPRTAQD